MEKKQEEPGKDHTQALSLDLFHYRALGRTMKRRRLPDDEVAALRYARVLVAERLLDE